MHNTTPTFFFDSPSLESLASEESSESSEMSRLFFCCVVCIYVHTHTSVRVGVRVCMCARMYLHLLLRLVSFFLLILVLSGGVQYWCVYMRYVIVHVCPDLGLGLFFHRNGGILVPERDRLVQHHRVDLTVEHVESLFHLLSQAMSMH
jgi:hypothetical protein